MYRIYGDSWVHNRLKNEVMTHRILRFERCSRTSSIKFRIAIFYLEQDVENSLTLSRRKDKDESFDWPCKSGPV